MKKTVALLVLAASLTACGQKPTVLRDNAQEIALMNSQKSEAEKVVSGLSNAMKVFYTVLGNALQGQTPSQSDLSNFQMATLGLAAHHKAAQDKTNDLARAYPLCHVDLREAAWAVFMTTAKDDNKLLRGQGSPADVEAFSQAQEHYKSARKACEDSINAVPVKQVLVTPSAPNSLCKQAEPFNGKPTFWCPADSIK